ncbi:MAG: hypothetical protein WCL18_04855 [bacterium]
MELHIQKAKDSKTIINQVKVIHAQKDTKSSLSTNISVKFFIRNNNPIPYIKSPTAVILNPQVNILSKIFFGKSKCASSEPAITISPILFEP